MSKVVLGSRHSLKLIFLTMKSLNNFKRLANAELKILPMQAFQNFQLYSTKCGKGKEGESREKEHNSMFVLFGRRWCWWPSMSPAPSPCLDLFLLRVFYTTPTNCQGSAIVMQAWSCSQILRKQTWPNALLSSSLHHNGSMLRNPPWWKPCFTKYSLHSFNPSTFSLWMPYQLLKNP